MSSNTSSNPPEVEDGNEKYIVPALERGLRLLGEFGRESRALGAPELARRLSLPRSTVFRLLNTLEALGFIERTESGNDYRLGLAVLRMGFEYLSSLELTELGQPVLARLNAEIRYAVNLVVRDNRHIVYVAKVSPSTPFASSVRVGTRLPAHATVLGRILLEDLTLADLQALYPEPELEVFSSCTPKTTLDLFNMAQEDRERGYALGEGYFEASISTVAAPIHDHSGRVIAAMGATIPSAHIEGAQLDELVQRVRAAAEELSALLNYKPNAARAKRPSVASQ